MPFYVWDVTNNRQPNTAFLENTGTTNQDGCGPGQFRGRRREWTPLGSPYWPPRSRSIWIR
jgi:hypothetical protein